MSKCSVTSRCCAATLLKTVMSGKRGPSKGSGELLGEEDSPLPNMFGTMMKYFAGSRPIPSPISHSFSQWRPEYQVG